MKNLKSVSDDDLLKKIAELVKEERKLALEIIHHLHEIQDRKLYAARGFSSLYEYCVHLGYSEGAAHRRISVMRLLREIPEAEESIREGKVSLTTVSVLQNFFRSETKLKKEYSRSAKLALFKSMEYKSKRACE